MWDGQFSVAPDLVVEIFSPGAVNERRDRELKLNLYSRQGGREYWIADWQRRGVLTKLDLAFSRDQPEKIYVQQRMRESERELWQWMERGAHFYVCGDAKRMAKDVEDTLLAIAAEHGKRSSAEAKAWLHGLAKAGRYQRDVY